ncbi:HEPN domain-containing protein [Pedobacter metabolipauper]|uniref:HEPN domain-containing protein n=1 Tax=Pedobacter metabolipauper TaxID=425513 RepID=A0A4R6SSW2_9SPHI|nr:HEPN domain-containing protein [Pedobacter metabolipauper]TDQ07691.1 HEPN domain-containing protein [Pedobacter metabolipauper]
MKNPQTTLKSVIDTICQKVSPEKIICFGSTEKMEVSSSCFKDQDAETEFNPRNNYSLLVVPAKQERLTNTTIQKSAEQSVKGFANIAVITHRMDEINLAIKKGSTFFSTLHKKGTILFDAKKEPFVIPATMPIITSEALKREKFWFHWFNLSDEFLMGAHFYASERKNGLAIFMIHQTLCHCYSGMLRVLTGYHAGSNGLRRLSKITENILPESNFILARNTPAESRLTNLLMGGFDDSRYLNKVNATNDDVTELITRAEKVLEFSDTVCLSHIQKIKDSENNKSLESVESRENINSNQRRICH